MRRRSSFTVGVILLSSLCGVASAYSADLPLVIAVDTSRSLSAAELSGVRTALSRQLGGLQDVRPLGLVRFDDDASWLLPVGGDVKALERALAGVAPSGRATVLNDALFVAAGGLPEGGVLLVVTDGRDEGSATTVDDVARLCQSNHVRVLAASVGRKVDEKALRRLALVSRGEVVGGLLDLDPARLAAAVERASTGIAGEHSAATARAVPAPVAPETATFAPPQPAVATPAAGRGLPSWLLPVALLLLVVAGGVGAWLVTHRRGPKGVVCERCGAVLEPWETACPQCQLRELEKVASAEPAAVVVEGPESVLDPEVFRKAPLPAGLANTLVLDEQPVLIARQRGKSARSYTLSKEQPFVVGRAPKVNSLQVDDPTVSAQHFKLVPKEEEYFVVDLDTTNGTLVNNQRVRVQRLNPGDVIRVGSLEFEFNLKVSRVS